MLQERAFRYVLCKLCCSVSFPLLYREGGQVVLFELVCTASDGNDEPEVWRAPESSSSLISRTRLCADCCSPLRVPWDRPVTTHRQMERPQRRNSGCIQARIARKTIFTNKRSRKVSCGRLQYYAGTPI